MSCWLCGNEEEDRHHLGCMRLANPTLTEAVARQAGLLPPLPEEAEAPEPQMEVLKEGSMTTVREMRTVEQCEFGECENPKYSDSPRTKYCEEHKDPKNRKE